MVANFMTDPTRTPIDDPPAEPVLPPRRDPPPREPPIEDPPAESPPPGDPVNPPVEDPPADPEQPDRGPMITA